MPETDEDVKPDEVSGVDADESLFRAVVIDTELVKGDHEDEDGGS